MKIQTICYRYYFNLLWVSYSPATLAYRVKGFVSVEVYFYQIELYIHLH